MIVQMSMFEYLDDTLAQFQKQIDLPLLNCRKGHSYPEQNRQTWILEVIDHRGRNCFTEVQTMLDDQRIVFASAIKPKLTDWRVKEMDGDKYREFWFDGCLFCRESETNQYEFIN